VALQDNATHIISIGMRLDMMAGPASARAAKR